MSRFRIYVPLALAIVAVSLASPVAAHDSVGAGSQPDEGVHVNPDGEPSMDDGYRRTGREGKPHRSDSCTGNQICPQHFDWSIHTHVITSFIRAYDGYKDRALTGQFLGPQTASYGQNTTYGNSWGASISFDGQVVSSAVNYNVSWSTSEWWSSSFVVPAGTKYRFYQRQWYHVRLYDAYTKTCLNPPGCSDHHWAFGTAWGGDWYDKVYSWRRTG
jgi:hypothetical protein